MLGRSRLLIFAALAGSFVVVACVGDDPTVGSSDAGGGDDSSIVDGSTTDSSTDTSTQTDAGSTGPCILEAPFGTPVQVNGLPPMSSIVRFSKDERTAYFALDPDGALPQLYRADRPDTTSAFAAAAPLATLNDANGESDPAVSRDGRDIIYTRGFSSAPVRDIWWASRIDLDASFTNPMAIASDVNLAGIQDDYPSLQSNDDLWFVSTRDGGDHDIFHAVSAGGISYMPTQKVGGVNGAPGIDQYYPVVADNGLAIFYDRGGTIYTATRTSTGVDFANPTRVAEINDLYADARPSWLSPDSCRLYFTTGSPQIAYVAARPTN